MSLRSAIGASVGSYCRAGTTVRAEPVVIIERMSEESARRVTIAGEVSDLPTPVRSRALELGVRGWVRAADHGRTLLVHAEGPGAVLDEFTEWLASADAVSSVESLGADGDRHEQVA